MSTESRGVADLPLLPLKNVVVFPRTIPIGLTVGRSKSIAAVEDAITRGSRLVVSAQKTLDIEDPGPDDLFISGTLVDMVKVERLADGTMQIIVEGIRRVLLQKVTPAATHLRAKIVDVADEPDVADDALTRFAIEQFERYVKLNRNLPGDALDTLGRVDGSGRLADLLAAYLPLDLATKQGILESSDPRERLERASIALANEIEIQELEQQIRSRVRQQMDKNQREYYLKEQLKAIHEELGSDSHGEAQEFLAKIVERGLPESVATKMAKEVARLEKMASSSPEGNVIRTYLDVVLSLPWQDRSDDRIDINEAQRILDDDHSGLDKVKERIIEFLAVRQLIQQHGESESLSSGTILCFVGPPGVGKTSLGRSIARSMNRKFVRLSLGGVRDEAEIRGHRRTYVGALPGRLIQAMRTVGTINPVILLDEIDKMTSDFRGDPGAALLEVLDPEQNRMFTDHYLEVPFDLSQVMFITTANTLSTIPKPLRDRMEVIEIAGYTEEEKVRIAQRFLLAKQVNQHGLEPKHISMTDKTVRTIIEKYTREAGVRNLERSIATICRKVATRVLRDEAYTARVTPAMATDLLGPPRFFRSGPLESNQVGVAVGLAWTEHGGEILPVEVATMPGKGGLTITGRLGDVMQESARAAVSYARSRATALNIPPDFQDRTDLHIHLPEGAVPKDGPSAGITMATALISALTRRPIRSDVAMTGEITLRGRVLPIGGLKEKALAAHRSGIREIIAPADNKRDLPEIPKKIRDQISVHWVSTMDQVLSLLLIDVPASPPPMSPPADDLPLHIPPEAGIEGSIAV